MIVIVVMIVFVIVLNCFKFFDVIRSYVSLCVEFCVVSFDVELSKDC